MELSSTLSTHYDTHYASKAGNSSSHTALAMVVIRINHSSVEKKVNIHQDSVFLNMNTNRERLNVMTRMESHDDFNTIQSEASMCQVIEFWNVPCMASEKQLFMEELKKVLVRNLFKSQSVVISQKFCILPPSEAAGKINKKTYYGYQWICSILPDSTGNILRITASLCTLLSPQVQLL